MKPVFTDGSPQNSLELFCRSKTHFYTNRYDDNWCITEKYRFSSDNQHLFLYVDHLANECKIWKKNKTSDYVKQVSIPMFNISDDMEKLKEKIKMFLVFS